MKYIRPTSLISFRYGPPPASILPRCRGRTAFRARGGAAGDCTAAAHADDSEAGTASSVARCWCAGGRRSLQKPELSSRMRLGCSRPGRPRLRSHPPRCARGIGRVADWRAAVGDAGEAPGRDPQVSASLPSGRLHFRDEHGGHRAGVARREHRSRVSTRESGPASLRADLFFTEPLVAVLPATHPFAAQKTLRVQMLRKEPFVFFPRRIGPAFHDVLLGECGQAGFAPNIVQEATQWQTVISLVEAGMGVTIAPACVEKFGWPGVVYRRLPGPGTKVYACQRTEAPASVANFLITAKRE